MWNRTEDVTNNIHRDKPAWFCPELFKSVEQDNCSILSAKSLPADIICHFAITQNGMVMQTQVNTNLSFTNMFQ